MSRQKGLQAVMLGAGRLGEMAASGMGLKVKRRSGPKSKSSPYLGVTQYKKTLRWEAHIWLADSSGKGKGGQKHLGSYTSAEEAAKCYDRAAIKTRGPQAELNFPYQSYSDDDFLKQHLRLGREPFLKLMRDTFALKSAAALPPPRRPAARASPTGGTSAAAAAAALQGRLSGSSSSDGESPSDASTQPSPRHQPLRDSGSSGIRSGDHVRLPLRRAATGPISYRELAREEEEEEEGSERDTSEEPEPVSGRLYNQGIYRAGSGGGRAPSVQAAAAAAAGARRPASAGATALRTPLTGLPGHKSAFQGVGEEDLLGDEHDLLLVQNPMAHSLGEEALWGAGASPLCLSPLQHRPSSAPLQALQWQQSQQQHNDIHPKQEQQPHLLPVQQAPAAFQQLQLAPERPMHFLPRSATTTPLLEGPLGLEGEADLLAPQPKVRRVATFPTGATPPPGLPGSAATAAPVGPSGLLPQFPLLMAQPLNLPPYPPMDAGPTLWAPLAFNMPGTAGSSSTQQQASVGLSNFGAGWSF